MRFKQFLLQEGSKKGPHTDNVGIEGAVKFFKENPAAFKQLQEKLPPIFRGMTTADKGDFHFGDLKDFERKAAWTDNYVNLFLSTTPSWKNVAKRNKSFICSSRGHGTTSYGTTYAVYPSDNAKVSRCEAVDFWDAFRGSVDVTVNNWNIYIAQFRHDLDISTTNAEALRHALTQMDVKFFEEHNKDPDRGSLSTAATEFFLRYLDQFELPNACELMDEVFKPEQNGIKTVMGRDVDKLKTTDDLELWVEGPTFFIRMEQSVAYFDKLRLQVLDAMK